MKLYNLARSGNCHKVRMLLAQLGVPHELVTVDLPSGESKSPAFLKLNPRGQIPVLEDAGEIIWDSQAILVYLARSVSSETWLPTAPLAMARVMQWPRYRRMKFSMAWPAPARRCTSRHLGM